MNPTQIVQNKIIIPLSTYSNRHQQSINDDQKYYFIVSQLANSGDMYEYISRNPLSRNDMESIRCLFKQMVKIVHVLHEDLNLWHRDLSVENFVIHDDQVFVIDFGQAQIMDVAFEPETVLNNFTPFGKVR